MRLGKLDNDKLNDLILKKFTHMRPEIVCSPQVGVDCAAVDLGGLAVLSTDPITSATKHLGTLTVCVSCNDAAAAGAEPVGLLVTFLIPPTATEEDVARVADELAAASRAANVSIIGGHTEVTDSVTRMVTCATVLARANKRGLITPNGMREGNDIVLTKYAGLEGTAVIASDFFERLMSAMTAEELFHAQSFVSMMSVVKEGLYAVEHGATAMHDVTEGGVLGAAWEMCEASGCGMRLDISAVPVMDVTKKICDVFSINPLRLLSSGAMLIACEDGNALVKGLGELGVHASVIGKACGTRAELMDGTPIAPPGADELYKLF